MLEKLLQDCKKSNRQAQAEIYKMFAPKLYGVCLKYSKNQVEAQDNLQEGFLLLFEKIESYKGIGSFEGWAKRLFINYILQQYRKKGLLFDVIEDHNIPDVVEEDIEEEHIHTNDLLELVKALPDRYKLVFNLYVMEEYSHKEIAVMLNITEGTSKSNLSRAKAILKDKILEKKTFFAKHK
jgi:RNA polymerase sigma factor (sigma-70 family)